MQTNSQRRPARGDNKPTGRPYKWDVLAKISIGTNRELLLEKRWMTRDDEKPHFIFVSVAYALTDAGTKQIFQDLSETIMFSEDVVIALFNGIGSALDALGIKETDEEEIYDTER